jgi:hypothetical protein
MMETANNEQVDWLPSAFITVAGGPEASRCNAGGRFLET